MIPFVRSRRPLLAATVAAVLSSACADLVTRNIRHEPFTTTTRVLKAEVANTGGARADATKTTVLTRTSHDQPWVERARATTAPLPARQSADLPLWPIPSTELPQAGGCLHVRVCADAEGTVTESSDSNNCSEHSFGNDLYCPSTGACCARDLPASFDWRSWNATSWLTPVRDQANCGSCWAFAANAVVEAAANLERRGSGPAPSLDLSEQQLVTCGGSGDCLGGWVPGALSYVQNFRLVSEATFPYQCQNCVTNSDSNLSCRPACTCPSGGPCSTPCTCTWSGSPQRWTIGSFRYLDVSGAVDKVAAVKRALTCRGPMAVCSPSWWHCILLVGWQAATQTSAESWIIKNSWGTGWGQGGFGTIPVSGDPRSDLVNDAYYVEDVQ